MVLPSAQASGININLMLQVSNTLDVAATMNKSVPVSVVVDTAGCMLEHAASFCLEGTMPAPVLASQVKFAAQKLRDKGQAGQTNSRRAQQNLMQMLDGALAETSFDGRLPSGTVGIFSASLSELLRATIPGAASAEVLQTGAKWLPQLVEAGIQDSSYSALEAINAVAHASSWCASCNNSTIEAIRGARAFASGVLASMTSGEDPLEVNGNSATAMQLSRIRAADLSSAAHTVQTGSATVEVPRGAEIQVGNQDVGLVMQAWRPGQLNGPNRTDVGGVVDFHFCREESDGFKEVVAANLRDPIVIRIPLAMHNRSRSAGAACMFYDPDSALWRADGCIIREVTQTEMVCACNHTTRFGTFLGDELRKLPFENFKMLEVEKFDAKVAAVFIAVFVVMELFGLVLRLKDRRDERRGISRLVDDNEAAIRAALALGATKDLWKHAMQFSFQTRHPLAQLWFFGSSPSLTRQQLWAQTSTTLCWAMLWTVVPDYSKFSQWSFGQYLWLFVLCTGGSSAATALVSAGWSRLERCLQKRREGKMAQHKIQLAIDGGYNCWFFFVKAALFFVAYTYAVRENDHSWVSVLLSTVAITFFVLSPLKCATYFYHQVCACWICCTHVALVSYGIKNRSKWPFRI